MSKKVRMGSMERTGMHMFASRYSIDSIRQIFADAGLLVDELPEWFIGRSLGGDRYVLAKFKKCKWNMSAIPVRLYRARLDRKPNGVPICSRQEILHLTDTETRMLTGEVEATCLQLAKLHRRIDIAMRKFRRHAELSVAVCRMALFVHTGMDFRAWHLVRMAHHAPGLAAGKINRMLKWGNSDAH